jgi:hypothetical protein
MDALRLQLPLVPPAGSVVVLDGVAWPEESFEVLAFLDVPQSEDARALSDADPRFLGRFFLYGSGVPRPDHAGKIGLSARLKMRPELAARAARTSAHTLVLVPRDANGEPLSAADLRVRSVAFEP